MRRIISLIKKNKGVSLVELVVTIAILVAVGGAVAAFFSIVMRNYQSNSAEINVQYQSQMAANQMGDTVLAATKGLYFDKKANSRELKVFGTRDDENAYFTWYKQNDEGSVDKGNQIWYHTSKVSEPELFATYIEDFDVQIYKADGTEYDNPDPVESSEEETPPSAEGETPSGESESTEPDRASRVVITLTYKNGNKTYTEVNDITLRNETLISMSDDDYAESAGPEVQVYGVSMDIESTLTDANYMWVGKSYPLIYNSESKEGFLIAGANAYNTEGKSDDYKALKWGLGAPQPSSKETEVLGNEGFDKAYKYGDSPSIKIADDEKNAFRVIATSAFGETKTVDGAISANEKYKPKTNSKMIYPRYISNISISSYSNYEQDKNSPEKAHDATVVVSVTVRNPGPNSETQVQSQILEMLNNLSPNDTGYISAYYKNKKSDVESLLISDSLKFSPCLGNAATSDADKILPIIKQDGSTEYNYYIRFYAHESENEDPKEMYTLAVKGNTYGFVNVEYKKESETDEIETASYSPKESTATMRLLGNELKWLDLRLETDAGTEVCPGSTVKVTPFLFDKLTREPAKSKTFGGSSLVTYSIKSISNLSKGTKIESGFDTYASISNEGVLSVAGDNVIKDKLNICVSVEYKIGDRTLAAEVWIKVSPILFELRAAGGVPLASLSLDSNGNKYQNYELLAAQTEGYITFAIYDSSNKNSPIGNEGYELNCTTEGSNAIRVLKYGHGYKIYVDDKYVGSGPDDYNTMEVLTLNFALKRKNSDADLGMTKTVSVAVGNANVLDDDLDPNTDNTYVNNLNLYIPLDSNGVISILGNGQEKQLKDKSIGHFYTNLSVSASLKGANFDFANNRIEVSSDEDKIIRYSANNNRWTY